MADLGDTIAAVRESVVAVMRIRPKAPAGDHVDAEAQQYDVSFGSGFCVAADRLVLTAFHVLNAGEAPGAEDRHYVFTVPANGDVAYHFPVTRVLLQRPELDIAVLEIGPCPSEGVRLPALPLTFEPQRDGARVLTLGFPAPEVHGLGFDAAGEFAAGQFFLKSHANEGIVAAHYELAGAPVYEVNVFWHHGESGGPIVSLEGEPAAFALMQQYRNVQSPHGIVAGPHRGLALSAVRDELRDLGVVGLDG